MSGSTDVARASRIATFATLGALGVTQDLIHACVPALEGADPELLAEESLCLVSTATARSVEVGLEDASAGLSAASACLLDLPFMYREYLVGGAIIAQSAPELADAHGEVEQRLARKQSFYGVHLPQGQFPGRRLLEDKMALWMGRISPPGLPDLPVVRLERLGLVDVLSTHLRLVLAYTKKVQADD